MRLAQQTKSRLTSRWSRIGFATLADPLNGSALGRGERHDTA